MVTRARHFSLLSDPKWQQALGRKDTVDKVLEFVVGHWATLQKNPPADMAFANPEPKITKFFGLSLRKHALSHGITGIFIVEHNVAEIDEIKQELASRGRTDITYFSNALAPALEFVFECKKLVPPPVGKSSRRQYAEHGVLRFVNGIYARDGDIGFMIGLVDEASNIGPTSKALTRMMQGGDMASLLRLITDENGEVVSEPSTRFAACQFETQHARDHIEGCPDVVLGHFTFAHRR